MSKKVLLKEAYCEVEVFNHKAHKVVHEEHKEKCFLQNAKKSAFEGSVLRGGSIKPQSTQSCTRRARREMSFTKCQKKRF